MRRLLLLLVLLLSTACGMGIMPRLMTGNGPEIVGVVHRQVAGILCVYDVGWRQFRAVEVAARLMPQLANTALVGATVAIWMNGDDLAIRLNIRGRDHFEPIPLGPTCKPKVTEEPAPPGTIQPAILKTTRVSS